jgi:hypothetical protein
MEKYMFNYTQGFLIPAMANFSLLGLLGFVHRILKLGIGKKAVRRQVILLSHFNYTLAFQKITSCLKTSFILLSTWKERKIRDHSE